MHLTPTEYRLLTTLIKHAGKVITHRQLLKEVWGPDSVEETHYLRVFMAQLRRKIEADPARPRCLLTEPGVGYRLARRVKGALPPLPPRPSAPVPRAAATDGLMGPGSDYRLRKPARRLQLALPLHWVDSSFHGRGYYGL